MTTPTSTSPCTECEAEISTAVEQCPECGHNPKRSTVGVGLGLMVLGGVLTIFVVTAILGIPLLLYGGYTVHKGRSYGPTTD